MAFEALESMESHGGTWMAWLIWPEISEKNPQRWKVESHKAGASTKKGRELGNEFWQLVKFHHSNCSLGSCDVNSWRPRL